jgi:hypothetical protein
MKMNVKAEIVSLLILCLMLFELSSCALINKMANIPELYWNESSKGSIETNDLTRLQKELPFNVILPKYLPHELKDSSPEFTKLQDLSENQIANLEIYYYALTNAKELHITENLVSNPSPLETINGMSPGYRLIKLAEYQVLEKTSGSCQEFCVKLPSINLRRAGRL